MKTIDVSILNFIMINQNKHIIVVQLNMYLHYFL